MVWQTVSNQPCWPCSVMKFVRGAGRDERGMRQ
jgi:hypothetical protein